MQFSYHCVECLLNMQFSRIRKETDMGKKLSCAQESLAILAGAPKGVAAPYTVPALDGGGTSELEILTVSGGLTIKASRFGSD